MGSHIPNGTARPHGHAEAADLFFERHGWTPVPQLVQWMVTLRCPLACPHCLAADGPALGDMPLSQAARLIEQVAELGAPQLLLTGGEPLAREDLPAILDMLRSNGVRWGLNTAGMPGPAARRAMEAWPPSFVAVSLDGPPEVHDRFRGRPGAFRDAMDGLAYYAELAPGQVAAGTTVTAWNLPHLDATFPIVAGSGASTWGLHLVVPEGRAARRADLLLSPAGLRRLLRFCAAKRQHFPVTMADEIGYCGSWEPLVRDEPFFCGAGRAQCVVLPDGEVVPCTTLDRATSAGNVTRQPLRKIWESGFAELRQWTPPARCAACDQVAWCRGGCWLQRRHGAQCFRAVWRRRDVLKAAAAACVGAALPLGAAARDAAARRLPVPQDFSRMEILQRCIVQWYAAQVGGRRAPDPEDIKKTLRAELPDDPGAKYFLDFAEGEQARDIASRAEAIRTALTTRQRSLCLVGLAWRDLTEWCLDGPPPGERSPEERQVSRELLDHLGATAEAWRREVFEAKLDPFLRRPTTYRRFFVSKAGPPPGQVLERGLARKRGWTAPGLTEAFLREHRHAEAMALSFEVTGGERVVCRRLGKARRFDGTLEVFDLLVVPAGCRPELRVRWGEYLFPVVLPPATELTYGDVVRIADEQNREVLETLARTVRTSLWTGQRGPHPAPLALPALRRLRARLHEEAGKGRHEAELRRVTWQLVDLYLF